MSNTNLSAAAKRIEQGARDLQWVIDVAKKLKEIGSIEQAESEISSKYHATSKAMSALETKVETAKKDLEALKVQKTKEEQEAKDRIRQIEKIGEDLYNKAEEEAEAIVAVALNEAQETRNSLQSDITSVEGRVKEEAVKLANVQDAVRQAKDNLVSLENKISSAKERAMKAYQEAFKSEIT